MTDQVDLPHCETCLPHALINALVSGCKKHIAQYKIDQMNSYYRII
jgi:hypothetical protein